MSAPAAPIDADLSEADGISYYVLELGALWLSKDLGGGSATWTQVLDTSELTEATGLIFTRVKCSVQTIGLVFVLGYALRTSDSQYVLYYFRSTNYGSVWTHGEVAEILDPEEIITMDTTPAAFNGGVLNPIQIGRESHYKVTYDGSKQFPGGDDIFGYIQLPEALPSSTTLTIEYDIFGTYPSADYNTAGDNPPVIVDCAGTLTAISGGFHFSGVLNTNNRMASDRSVLWGGWVYGDPPRWAAYTAGSRDGWITNLVIDGTAYGKVASGFDISRNTGALYVGCEDQIYKSLDSGFTWTAMPTAEGATDILVDPLLGGVIYYWCTDGKLKQAVADAAPKDIMTATRQDNPCTIARDWLSGKVYAIDASGNLKSSTDFVTWSTHKTGLSSARGLKAYYASPTKLVFVDTANIYQSVDDGANWTLKKGAWSPSVPMTVHLLPQP